MADERANSSPIDELGERAMAMGGILASVLDGVLLCDAAGCVVGANAAAEDLFGVSLDAVQRRPLNALLFDLDDDPAKWPQRLDHRVRARGGARVVEATISSCELAGLTGYVVVARDITDRAEWEEQLQHRTLHDSLTDLPNRAHFTGLVGRAVARLRRHGGTSALLFLDLDNFKRINEELGHDAGDGLLAAAAQRLASAVRADDAVARLGGDEFGVLLENTSMEGATQLADRLLAETAEPFLLFGHEVTITASIGLALAEPGAVDAQELMRRGDVAMYVAKRSGKDRSARFEPSMDAATRGRLQLEADLRHAPARGELRLHYQPLFGIASGEVHALEALLRWEHSLRGLLPPAAFIDLAEETGLIVPVGEWVLEEAAAEHERLQGYVKGEIGIPVQVNVSARQFRDPAFLGAVAAIFERHHISRGGFGIEITESLFLEGTEVTIDLLTRLHELGVSISVDDFGIRYSSLTYLRRFPIDVLKLDRSFIEHIADEVEARAVVRAVIRLGHDLGLIVVAEGVENEEQLTLLQEWGCDAAQGFLLSRPMPADQLQDFFAG
jgi:diguanylate cyclase (GGDEF)-like protein/PAS domain S-box-containing protein